MGMVRFPLRWAATTTEKPISALGARSVALHGAVAHDLSRLVRNGNGGNEGPRVVEFDEFGRIVEIGRRVRVAVGRLETLRHAGRILGPHQAERVRVCGAARRFALIGCARAFCVCVSHCEFLPCL